MNKKLLTSLILSVTLSLLFTGIALLVTKHFACSQDDPIDESEENDPE